MQIDNIDEIEDFLITTRMVHNFYKGCFKGYEEFCARHGLDYREVTLVGISAKTLYKTGDAVAMKTVEYYYGQK